MCLVSCQRAHSDCIQAFSVTGLTFGSGGWVDPYNPSQQYDLNPSNQAICDDNRNICEANCQNSGVGSGGGSNSGLVGLSSEQQESLQRCIDTMGVANANKDTFITHDEYLLHVDQYASNLCPDFLRPVAYADEFESISCLLCAGLLDPYNPAADDGNCPCLDGTSPTAPIAVDDESMTLGESLFYCDLVLEAASISCSQPDKTCYDSCYVEEKDCQEKCIEDMGDNIERDAFMTCILECNTPFYTCLADCPTPQAVRGSGTEIATPVSAVIAMVSMFIYAFH